MGKGLLSLQKSSGIYWFMESWCALSHGHFLSHGPRDCKKFLPKVILFSRTQIKLHGPRWLSASGLDYLDCIIVG